MEYLDGGAETLSARPYEYHVNDKKPAGSQRKNLRAILLQQLEILSFEHLRHPAVIWQRISLWRIQPDMLLFQLSLKAEYIAGISAEAAYKTSFKTTMGQSAQGRLARIGKLQACLAYCLSSLYCLSVLLLTEPINYAPKNDR